MSRSCRPPGFCGGGGVEEVFWREIDLEIARRLQDTRLLGSGNETRALPSRDDVLARAHCFTEALLSDALVLQSFENALGLGHGVRRFVLQTIIAQHAIVKRDKRLSRFGLSLYALRMTFSKRLIAAREKMDMSQTALGDEAGAGQSTVATWERGKNEPNLAMIKRLAKILNTAPEWLAFGTGLEGGVDTVALLEIDSRAISGPGGLVEVKEDDSEAILNRYYFPKSEFRRSFGVSGENVRIQEVIGDSMLGTLNPGEKVIIDFTDTTPSPPGIFVVWDGLTLVLKRVEYIAQSDPPRVRISSDNPRYQPYERTLDEAYIQGRIIGSWQRR